MSIQKKKVFVEYIQSQINKLALFLFLQASLKSVGSILLYQLSQMVQILGPFSDVKLHSGAWVLPETQTGNQCSGTSGAKPGQE